MTEIKLEPRPGFNWGRVVWFHGHSEMCSYCLKPIPDHVVPLILFSDNGLAAYFGDCCMVEWFGFEPMPPEPDYD